MSQLLANMNFGPRLEVSARSIAGVRRDEIDENQDNYLLIDGNGRAVFLYEQNEHVIDLPNWPQGQVRLAVLDGMGGHGQGREAAEAVAVALANMPACNDLPTLCKQLDALHYAIQQRFTNPKHSKPSSNPRKPPGTTLVLLEIPANGEPLLYHVGDSRLYEIDHDKAKVLTVDHVPATGFAMNGMIEAQDWWQQVHGEDRSQISQAFVLGNTLSTPYALSEGLMALTADNLPPFLQHLPDRRALAPQSDALYLLSTDGMWACQEPQSWITRWPELLNKPGKRIDYLLDDLFTELIVAPPDNLTVDNVTAIAVRFKNGRLAGQAAGVARCH